MSQAASEPDVSKAPIHDVIAADHTGRVPASLPTLALEDLKYDLSYTS